MLSSLSFHSQSPALALLVSEPARAFVDLVASRAPREALASGDGHRVIVYPGLGAGAWSTVRLRTTLAVAGFDGVDWGFGLNRGPRGGLRNWLEQLAAAADAQSARDGRKVSLVGWSLGGIYAREIARAVPYAVRQVVTLGSPFGAEAEATHAGWLYRLLSGSEPPRSPGELQDLRRPLPVPSTSVFSKADGIVPWQGCLQKEGPISENIEVPGVSHLGMGTHRAVLALVAERLAQPEGAWKPRSAAEKASG
jgi:pimeloyl-ACP methyl ester carboxylesterase